jgi:hypothetical protein
VLPLGKNGLYLQQNTTQGGTTVFLQGRDSCRWWQILVVVTSRSNKDGQRRNQGLFESGNCGTETGLLKKSKWSKEDCGNL